MTESEALQQIRDAGLRGLFRLTVHAQDRMAERGARWTDVRHGLANAGSCTRQVNGNFKTETHDLDGDDLTLIVALDGDVVVVTLF